LILLLNAYLLSVDSAAAPKGSVSMKIINNSGYPIELYWVNTFIPIPELIIQTKPIRNSSDTVINSFDTHQFVVKFLDKKRGKKAKFIKGSRDEVVTITYDDEKKSLIVRQTTKFDEIMDTIAEGTYICSDLKSTSFSKCVADIVYEDVNRITDSKERAAKYRDILSSRLRNYTCLDDTLETTEAISSYDIDLHDKTVRVDILQDLINAQVWTVDDFISLEECDILMKHGAPLLQRATVASEDGSSVVSESRKAQQASYNFYYQKDSDPLWPLFTRILQLTNSHAGFNLEPSGQEDFTIIQYNPSDQYFPHCDGSCDGSMHLPGGRVATAVMYCKVPERGGATTFTKSDLYIKPKAGMATFFSYKGPDGRMDEGYTEHSGCPVIEGEKWITTLWMREGVSYYEPWTMFDPQGVKLLKPEDYGEHVKSEL